MKKVAILILFICFGMSSANAQECNSPMSTTEGATLTYAKYNKKGKLETTSKHTVTSIENSDGSKISTITLEAKDNKDKTIFDTTYKVTCNNGLYSIDMMRFMDTSKLSSYGDDITMNVDGTVLEFPKTLSVGTNLSDGDITIEVYKGDFKVVTMQFDVFNRKVVAQESVTTKAGTFDCYKVSYDFESKFGIIKVKGSATEWYKDDKLLVKSESYNKKGKLIGYDELIKVE